MRRCTGDHVSHHLVSASRRTKVILGSEMIKYTSEKVESIRKWIKAAQDRQKSYVYKRWTKLEFEVDDLVFVKISPFKQVMKFGDAGKLPQCVSCITFAKMCA